jgi:hypothetical protein
MQSLLGSLNEQPLTFPGLETRLPDDIRQTQEKARRQGFRIYRGAVPNEASLGQEAQVFPFPYLAVLRSLVEQGRILDARNLLEIAGDAIPQDSRIRHVLAPPRVRKSSVLGADRSSEFRWLKANAEVFRGKWVALDGDSLITYADSLKDLLAQLHASPPPRRPLIHRIE